MVDDNLTSFELKQLLNAVPFPIEEIRRIAIECRGGLQSSDVRKRVWPKLLNINKYEVEEDWAIENIEKPSLDIRNQISLDVSRSLHVREANETNGDKTRAQKKRSNKLWQGRRSSLQEIIENVIGENGGDLHYYQVHYILEIILLLFLRSKICLKCKAQISYLVKITHTKFDL